MKHLRFFPYGSRGSTRCFHYLTSLKKPANFVKWLKSYNNGVWDPTILQQNQIDMEKPISSKLSALGRNATLSQRNAVILGYLKALGYGGLYSLKRGGLQRKLDDYMVKNRLWEPAKGNIELPTKRRSWKKKQPIFKQKKQVELPIQDNTAKNNTTKMNIDSTLDISTKVSSDADVVHNVVEKKSHTAKKKKKNNIFLKK